MLHPESSAAAGIAWLWWFLFAVCGMVFLIVMILTAIAVLVPRRDPQAPPPVGNRFIAINGAIIPTGILIVILLASVKGQVALTPPETELTVEVTGHMWWWEVAYPQHGIRIANEIYMPAGEPVRVELQSNDVIHSLWVPNLQGKTDLLPDKKTLMWLSADRPGIFRGQCAEYCGLQHALMGFRVIVMPREEFDAWIVQRQQPLAEPQTDSQQRGREVFYQEKCNNCHTIADKPATGDRGPDLTHIGSRQTIGAGLLPNNRGNLAGWISNPQALKPGNLMPATYLAPDDLHALLDYLQSLQ